MKHIILLIGVTIVFAGCSFKIPENSWQIKSNSAFKSYSKNFLYGFDAMAKNDLQRAIKHAKMSADLTTLARIYLGKCALNISVGIQDTCEEYTIISDIVHDNTLDAYYRFITATIEKKQIIYLPENYQEFAMSLHSLDSNSANNKILKMNTITSKLLSASLLKDKLSITTIQSILNDASFYGYKRAVLYWLKVLQDKTITSDEKNIINKKIIILKSLS